MVNNPKIIEWLESPPGELWSEFQNTSVAHHALIEDFDLHLQPYDPKSDQYVDTDYEDEEGFLKPGLLEITETPYVWLGSKNDKVPKI